MRNSKDILDPRNRSAAAEYPLTGGEHLVLAEHWWTVVLDLRAWWTLSANIGGSEARDHHHALDRLELLAAKLGRDEIERTRLLAEARLRERLGEKLWAAFREGRPLLQENAQRRTARRGGFAWWR